ncbi:MAG: S8 family serine peptidase [Pseudomonadota bacterium]
MKFLLFALIISSPAFAEKVVVFKDHIQTLPAEFVRSQDASTYTVKKYWNTPRFAIQSLPDNPWENAKRQKNLAVLLKDTADFGAIPKNGIKSIEENTPYQEEDFLGNDHFDPVSCPGVIYGFHHYSEATQRLESATSCDVYSIRPSGRWQYTINVVSSTPKLIEVFEHGSKIGESRTGKIELNFNYGYRQRYFVISGSPGEYRTNIFPTKANRSKEKLVNFAFSDQFSNAYGFGVPNSVKLMGPTANTSKYIGANMMAAESFWTKGFKGKGIKVAVVDTGIDARHPLLEGVVRSGIEIFGMNTSPEDFDDFYGHGTHVAGIIHQVAPEAEIMAVRVFDETQDTGVETLSKGIRWAIDNGANVINLSLGGPDGSKDFKKIFEYGVSKGVLFAIATGNERGFVPLFPAIYAGDLPGLGLAVGAANAWGNIAPFSNWGGNNLNMKMATSHGVGVSSAKFHTDEMVNMSGTSMASPQIAGILALYKNAFPNLKNQELVDLISKNVVRAAVDD